MTMAVMVTMMNDDGSDDDTGPAHAGDNNKAHIIHNNRWCRDASADFRRCSLQFWYWLMFVNAR